MYAIAQKFSLQFTAEYLAADFLNHSTLSVLLAQVPKLLSDRLIGERGN